MLVLDLKDVGRRDIAVAGGKGANLGELVRAGFPVPRGFVVTTAAHDRFMADNHLDEIIAQALSDPSDGATIRAAMEEAPIPADRSWFLELLTRARYFAQLREDTRFYATMVLPPLHRALLEFGRRLNEVGVLDAPEDVFHLKFGELERVAGTWPPAPRLADELRAAVRRRKEHRTVLADTPLVDPRLLRREPEGDALVSGTPGSPGVAEGPVRVIHDTSEFGKLLPGEVLVAQYTNPAWTPLFQRAAAVVVDSGGPMSHAAIVAREYGIPAVMATVDGTRRLADDQRVRVDGTRGSVTLVER